MTRNKSTDSRVYLKPGQVCITTSPTRITTVLGSCVSATLFYPATGAAAICHAVQPMCKHYPNCSSHCDDKYKYVSCVIPTMIHMLSLMGIRPGDLELKLFGGAAVIGRKKLDGDIKPVGQMNVEAAMKSISKSGLKLKVADVGGVSGRKIIFDTKNGEVLLRRLGRAG